MEFQKSSICIYAGIYASGEPEKRETSMGNEPSVLSYSESLDVRRVLSTFPSISHSARFYIKICFLENEYSLIYVYLIPPEYMQIYCISDFSEHATKDPPNSY